MSTVRTVKTIGTSVLLESSLGRGHVFHTVRAVVAVYLVRHTETTPDIKAVPAEVQPADWLEGPTAALVPHKVQH